MKRLGRVCAAGVLGLALAALLTPAVALAEIEVLESSVSTLTVGSKFPDDTRVKVPDGAAVRVLILSSGTTKTLNGPYEGTVAAYKDDRGWWERITGRNKAEDAPIGATRGMRPAQ